MQYKYDIFISYTTKDKDAEIWAHDHFKPMLEKKLNSLIPHEAKIFIDKDEIEIGNQWQDKLKAALSTSKLFVPLYGPKYFMSDWCLFELWSFIHRQQMTNFQDGLICPIQISDGNYNPPYANCLQEGNFCNFFRTSAAFSSSQKYAEFEEKTILLATTIEKRLHSIPECTIDWNSEPWWEDIKGKIPLIDKQIFSKPIL